MKKKYTKNVKKKSKKNLFNKSSCHNECVREFLTIIKRSHNPCRSKIANYILDCTIQDIFEK